MWLSIDESKPSMGMEEDVFKLFVSGGSLCLRKNHEAETHYDNWSRCGETRAMNPDDIPHVASAVESSYKRRLRCARMREMFTSIPSDVNQDEKIFLRDDALREWIRRPGATSAFRALILMPPIRKSPKESRERDVQTPSVGAENDTLWRR